MFGNKRVVTIELATIEKPVPLGTPEYIRENTRTLWVNSEEIKKRVAISSVTSHSYSGGMTSEIAENLQKCGFRVFVKSEFASDENFPYYALVKGKEKCCYNIYNGREYIYIGDIPISVVEKAQIAIKQGINYLTIHSKQPLPIVPLHATDPVLIGWVDNPRMFGRWDDDGGNMYRNILSIGVIIAVWDNDKEMEL